LLDSSGGGDQVPLPVTVSLASPTLGSLSVFGLEMFGHLFFEELFEDGFDAGFDSVVDASLDFVVGLHSVSSELTHTIRDATGIEAG
jgi:hypothetical protein